MSNNISAIILAGGQGRRFNNKDKGLITWHQQPLIDHVIARISPQVSQIIISCNRNLDQYQSYGYQLCKDQLENFQGPLAGIHAGLPYIKNPLCLVCPCDTPNLPMTLAAQLEEAMHQHEADICYPCVGQRQHYLPALIKTTTALSLQDYLQGSERSVHGWYKSVAALAVEYTESEHSNFANINSAEQQR
jgi:molybdopterin-guanine dinucleotide biosynthesis protein A